jgi:hypothetical protein
MAINVTKPSVNRREKLNELETNKGLKGNEILQAETAQEVRSLIGAGRKNLIINGGFDVWQRGTSQAAAGMGSADRWSGNALTAMSKQYDNTIGNILRCTTEGNSNQHLLRTDVELYEAGSTYPFIVGKQYTVSFKAKSSVTMSIDCRYRVGSQGSGAVFFTSASIGGNGIWEDYSFTFTVPANSDAARNCMQLYIRQDSDTLVVDIDIAQVQLELGSVATDFEHRSFGEELALCQRYCVAWQSNGNPLGTGGAISTSGARSALGFGNAHNTSNPVTWLELPVVLRNAPTLTVSAVGDFQFDRGWAGLATYTNMSIQALRSSYKTIALIGSTTGLNNGDAGVLDFNKTTAYLILDAEL